MPKFRKRINIAPGVRLNVSKSGVSSTFGVKGASVNMGKDGAFLNTGLPGTGIYDRTKLGSNAESGGSSSMSNSNGYRTNESGYSVINANEIDFNDESSIPPYPKNKIRTHIILSVLFGVLPAIANPIVGVILAGIVNLIYISSIKGKQKQWQAQVDRHNILKTKLKAIIENEYFGDAKIFMIDLVNIIAFSEKGYIAFWTNSNTEELKIFEAKNIQKINQEVKSGPCYAHFYTNDFNNNVVSLFLGVSSGKETTENIRKLYNEIKGLFGTLKKNNKE